jgi:AraC-like DNA-binding protein
MFHLVVSPTCHPGWLAGCSQKIIPSFRTIRNSSSRTKAVVLYFLSNAVLGSGSSVNPQPSERQGLSKNDFSLLGNHYSNYHVSLRQFRRRHENINRLRPVMKFLDEHIGEPITVGDAASIVHMSKSHFMHFFRNVTGQAFVTYINQLRVAKAEELLAATDIPIADLCQQVGFCDQSYFGTVFRKLVGMPPAIIGVSLRARRSKTLRKKTCSAECELVLNRMIIRFWKNVRPRPTRNSQD